MEKGQGKTCRLTKAASQKPHCPRFLIFAYNAGCFASHTEQDSDSILIQHHYCLLLSNVRSFRPAVSATLNSLSLFLSLSLSFKPRTGSHTLPGGWGEGGGKPASYKC